MEARALAALPAGDEWQYEPKWDGFRCIAARAGERLRLWSKAGKPLDRYFPEVAARLLALPASRFCLDGELVIDTGGALSFDALLQRIHPAASRIAKLAHDTPALYVVFDLLEDEHGSLFELPLALRRPRLERFAARVLRADGVVLSPSTRSLEVATDWYRRTRGGVDGVIAKRLDQPYRSGERDGMAKVKFKKTADCVVGGYRKGGKGGIGSLLLGLYEDGKSGVLHHVGFTASFGADQRQTVHAAIAALETNAKAAKVLGFSGKAPGGPSRWARGRDTSWVPLPPTLVVEVEFDHASGGRFRHGTRLVRFRPDKAPRQCTMEQLEPARTSPLALVARPKAKRKAGARDEGAPRATRPRRPQPSREARA